MVKIVTLFLIGMLVLAMFGRLRLPGADKMRDKLASHRCKSCGRFRIGSGPCPCGRS